MLALAMVALMSFTLPAKDFVRNELYSRLANRTLEVRLALWPLSFYQSEGHVKSPYMRRWIDARAM